jgi:hypothetical protein
MPVGIIGGVSSPQHRGHHRMKLRVLVHYQHDLAPHRRLFDEFMRRRSFGQRHPLGDNRLSLHLHNFGRTSIGVIPGECTLAKSPHHLTRIEQQRVADILLVLRVVVAVEDRVVTA